MTIGIIFFSLFFLFQTSQKFERGIFLLFLLLPTYLIRFQVGPLPSTLLEIMILLLAAVWLLKGKNYKTIPGELLSLWREHKLLVIGTLLFVIGATVSIFTSVDIKKALGEWRAFYIEPLILFFVLKQYLQKLSPEKKYSVLHNFIFFPLILCGLITSLLAIYQHFTGFLVPHAFWANRDTYRVTAWYGFPNAVGLFLAPIFPLALYLIKKTWQRTKKVLHPIIALSSLFLPTSILAILFAKGSGPLLGVGAGIGVLLLIYKKTRIITILLGVLGIVGLFLLPNDHAIKQELLAKNFSGQLRRDMWQETVELLKDRPIQGAGIASYEERIAPYRQNKKIEIFHHPHNIFLTTYVNTGLLGLLGFIITLIWCVKTGLQNLKLGTQFILSSLAVILLMGLVDSPYIKNDLALLFWLLPTLLLSLLPPKTENSAR